MSLSYLNITLPTYRGLLLIFVLENFMSSYQFVRITKICCFIFGLPLQTNFFTAFIKRILIVVFQKPQLPNVELFLSKEEHEIQKEPVHHCTGGRQVK